MGDGGWIASLAPPLSIRHPPSDIHHHCPPLLPNSHPHSYYSGMAKKPLFESEQTRQWVIAAVMIALLGCSLGLAFLATKREYSGPVPLGLELTHQQIETLDLDMPAGWKLQSKSEA